VPSTSTWRRIFSTNSTPSGARRVPPHRSTDLAGVLRGETQAFNSCEPCLQTSDSTSEEEIA
jgi:hypothetical protein